MAEYVKQALALVDLFAKEAKAHDFAPLNPHDVRLDWQKALHDLTDGKINATIDKQKEIAEAALDKMLNADQRGLRAKHKDSIKQWLEINRRKMPGSSHPVEPHEVDEAHLAMKRAGALYRQSIKNSPKIKAMEEQIDALFYMGVFVHTDEAHRRIKEFADAAKDKKALTITLPTENHEIDPAHAFAAGSVIVEEALRRQGLSLHANANQMGYAIQKDSFDPHALHLLGTDNADPIDFADLRRKVQFLGRELSQQKWHRMPSAEIAYEHTAPYPGKDESGFLTRHVIQAVSDDYPDEVILRMKAGRRYMNNPASDEGHPPEKTVSDPISSETGIESPSLPENLALATKVLGKEAIEDILIKGLGVKGLNLGKRQR